MTNHQPDPHSLARTSPLVEPIWERQPFETAVEAYAIYRAFRGTIGSCLDRLGTSRISASDASSLVSAS